MMVWGKEKVRSWLANCNEQNRACSCRARLWYTIQSCIKKNYRMSVRTNSGFRVME